MRPTIRFLSTFALTVAIVPGHLAADPPEPESIETLIEQLGHKHFRVRQAAGKSLEARGEDALPLLRKSLNHSDQEIRRRAEVLTEKIERNLLLSPKRVTLQVTNRPLDQVLKDIGRQTGYRLVYQANGQSQKVTLNLKDALYWDAMQEICSSAGLSYNVDELQGQVYLYPQNTFSPYVSVNGPFRFVASTLSYNRFINLANLPRNGVDPNQQQDTLGFNFFIQAEPKTPLLAVGAPRVLKAEDENGLSLLPHNAEAEYTVRYEDFNQFRAFQHQSSLQMHKRNKDSQKAKIIQGKVMLTLLSSVRPDATVENLSVGMKKKASGTGSYAEIDVEALTPQNKDYFVTLHIKRRGTIPENDYNWINTLQQKLELLDEKGRKFTCQGINSFIGNTPTTVHGIYVFNPPLEGEVGKPVKLVLNQWLTLSEEVEFTFKDLPLP
jgi:hypothetical protein